MEANDDLGWQRPTSTSRKFHYLAVDKGREHIYGIWQRSLCGRYGLPKIDQIEPDIEPPNNESCKRCADKWRGTYGHKV